MYQYIFYFISTVIIASAGYIAFSQSQRGSAFTFVVLLFSISGLLFMLNSEFFSIISVLFIISIISVLLIIFPKITKDTDAKNPAVTQSYLVFVSAIGVLTALVASLISSARWQLFEINFSINNFGNVLMKYSPLLILLGLLASVFIFSLSSMFNKEDNI